MIGDAKLQGGAPSEFIHMLQWWGETETLHQKRLAYVNEHNEP